MDKDLDKIQTELAKFTKIVNVLNARIARLEDLNKHLKSNVIHLQTKVGYLQTKVGYLESRISIK